jgi:aromatic ring hydroxylase
MVESINGAQPPAQQLLGELWSYAELTRAAVAAAEDAAYDYGNGVWCPATGPLAALRALLPTWMPRATEIIRLLGSHHLLTAPSLSMIRNAELKPLLDRYLCGVNDVSAETRARVFRLAWDFAGTGLAGRNDQYERFYLASGARNQQIAHLTADRTRAFDLVERFLREDVE